MNNFNTDVCSMQSPCLNGATCLTQKRDKAFLCNCTDGFFGDICQFSGTDWLITWHLLNLQWKMFYFCSERHKINNKNKRNVLLKYVSKFRIGSTFGIPLTIMVFEIVTVIYFWNSSLTDSSKSLSDEFLTFWLHLFCFPILPICSWDSTNL